MNNIKVAFIVVGWNNEDLLKECLESIKSQTYKSIKIIYVDNGSSDKSVEFVRSRFEGVEIVEAKRNLGFAKGNNEGIKKALDDKDVSYIALLNTDATLEKNWAETIVNFAKIKSRGAAFQTLTLDYYDHKVIDSSHIYVAHNGQATQGSWRRPILDSTDVAPQKIFGCNAAAVIFSRDFIESQPFSDFFDEEMFMYLEDVDVAVRATVMGWDNFLVPGSRAYHMGSASSSKNPGFSLYMTFRNNSCMLVKNFHLIILIRMLPKLIRGDIDTVKVLWRTGRKKAIKAVIKGRLMGIIRSPLFIGKRIALMKKHEINYKTLWLLMNKGF